MGFYDENSYGKFNPEVESYLKEYNEANGYGTEVNDLLETLLEEVHVEDVNYSNNGDTAYFDRIVRLGEKYISFPYGETFNENYGLFDTGFRFNLSLIREVSLVETLKTVKEFV